MPEWKAVRSAEFAKIQKKEFAGAGISLYMMYAQDISETEFALLRRCMPKRMKKTDAFRSEEGRKLSAAAGYLMWTVLGLEDEGQLQFAEHGKPYAAGFPPFSVSHSKGMAVLAVANPENELNPTEAHRTEAHEAEGHKKGALMNMRIRQLGVDVEWIRERRLNVARRAFVQGERDWIGKAQNRQEELERFYRLWTLKESVMKADGRGLGIEMQSFEVLGLMEGKTLEMDGNIWKAFSIKEGEYMISVCSNDNDQENAG